MVDKPRLGAFGHIAMKAGHTAMSRAAQRSHNGAIATTSPRPTAMQPPRIVRVPIVPWAW
jgi:hypothetical protein